MSARVARSARYLASAECNKAEGLPLRCNRMLGEIHIYYLHWHARKLGQAFQTLVLRLALCRCNFVPSTDLYCSIEC